MTKSFSPYWQYLLPQQWLTQFAGCLANSRTPWLKNYLISGFLRRYDVNMAEAIQENPLAYSSYNDFFIRRLKPGIRPIAEGNDSIACPVDGTIAQLGHIKKNQLLQAKQYYFDLDTLVGDHEMAQAFYEGEFATLYLAPHNYHRVHMPLTGQLIKTIYIPGKLFSVNRMTSEIIPNLYSRNERLVSIFNTEAGRMAVIMVGAMIVGNMQTVWMTTPVRATKCKTDTFEETINLKKGEEIGYFHLGSTVILLFENNRMQWSPSSNSDSSVVVGQCLGNIIK